MVQSSSEREPSRSTPSAPAHLDADAMALIAIGEAPAARHESRHLDDCPDCRSELAALREAADIARTTLGEGSLSAPSAGVWASIRGELGLSADLEPPAPRPVLAASAPRPADAAAPPTDALAPVASLADARARSGRLRRFVTPLIAVAAVAAVATTVGLSWNALRPAAAPVDVASASLDALPAWSGASGDAVVTESASGERVVSIDLASVDTADGVREVWLLTPEVDGLISLGLLEGDSGEFVIPRGIDLGEFPIVDVSLEPVDGDPAHSGDSIVRGTLGA